MEENFGKEHEEATGTKIRAGGYPDCGSGRYTIKAGYLNWMNFNKSVRIHLNYVESLASIITMELICGLHFTRTTAIWGGIYLAARIMY